MNTTRENAMYRYAKELAGLSKCTKRGVAALITNTEFSQIYSIGVNGGASKLDQCLCELPGKYGCIHAEIAALIKLQREATGLVMVCTLAPCQQCAAAIINAGISKVIVLSEWHESYGIDMLQKRGIVVTFPHF